MCSLRSLSLTLAASWGHSSLFMAWSSIPENPYRECKNETQASMAEGGREPEECRISPKGVRSYTHTHLSCPLPLSKPRVDTGLVSCEGEEQHPENWCLRLVSKKLVTPSNWLPSLGLNLHIHKRWLNKESARLFSSNTLSLSSSNTDGYHNFIDLHKILILYNNN